MKKIPLVAVVGPTASGKTALGVALAKKYGGEIVSADSMQVYTGMDIATAKPALQEREGIPHHMMGFLDPKEPYSVALYADGARRAIEEIHGRGKLPILVGGTGLYISTLLNNIQLPEESGNSALRQRLMKRLEEEGPDKLLGELSSFDPESALRLSREKNGKRIVRAIEIYRTTGKTMTSRLESSRKTPSPYQDVRIGLKCRDRDNLYKRINERVGRMLEDGLLAEAEAFLSSETGQTAKMAIGYKELKPYFDGQCTLLEASEKLKQETRRYAKRQLTWFLRDDKIHWIDTDIVTAGSEVVSVACRIIEDSKILNNLECGENG